MSASVFYGAEAALAVTAEESRQQAEPEQRTAADIASARVAARLRGQRVEALSERTGNSTTWANPSGTLTTELSAGDIRFRDPLTGQWRDVDLNLVTQADGTVASKGHPKGLRLAKPGGERLGALKDGAQAVGRNLVTLGEGDQSITLQWKGGLPKPKLDGPRATYADAVPGGDVIVEATRTGFEQFVAIKQRPAESYTYTLPLKAKGLKVEQLADGSLAFTDKSRKKRAVMPAPVMWDAQVDQRSGEYTNRARVGMKAVQRTDGVDLVLTPDAKFLADPKTRYPVTVDPATSALSNVFDTYTQQGETVDKSTDTELDLGNPGTTNADGTPRTAHSFITWNTAPVADAIVSSAKLSLFNFHSANTDCAVQPWEVWSAGKASTSSRWTSEPAWTAKKATSSETKGNPACTAAPDGWINADVTTLVQEWATAKNSTSGMGLRTTSETAVAQWKRVNSANAASNPPKLVVTYNHRPKTGTKQEAGAPYFSYGGAYVVNSVTPTLRDTFTDPNGDKVSGSFQVQDATTSTQVGSVLVSKAVASGQPASVQIPTGLLSHGKTYRFRTNASDGTHSTTDWSAWKTFTVDTAAPSAPGTITSTDYPTDQWVKGAGQPGTFTVTPPSADHNWLEWSLDGVTWTKVATGGSTAGKAISVTPPRDGNHTLQVRSVDKADNKSEAAEYDFHAGPGGFLQPTEGERTARRLPLQVEVDAAKYNSVSFSWRRSAADAWVRIPTGNVTQNGNALTAWPVPLTGGKNASLVWNATDTVSLDGTVQIKADFTGASAAAGATEPLTVIVDRNADGAATESIGPGTVNLLTGDYKISPTDASFFGLSVTRTASSRTPNRGAAQEDQAAIFGKEWVSGVLAEEPDSDFTFIKKVTDTALDVVQHDGTEIGFTANSGKTGWVPEPGYEHLTLSGAYTGSFTLTDNEGGSTTFAKPDAALSTWPVQTAGQSGLTDSTSTTVSETVTVAGKTLARPKLLIAPTPGIAAATCRATPSTRGCRALEFVYATATTATGTATDAEFGDFAGQVKEIRLWSTVPGATTATSTAVAGYRYDKNGSLRQTWDPRIGRQAETQYAYWEGRVEWLEPAGQLAYSFAYGNAGVGTAPGDGMLLEVSRPTLKQGSADVTEADGVTSLVYGVPLSGTGAPYAMSASEVAKWGQHDLPSDATAVFPADAVPASHAGSGLTAEDYRRANVHYLDASARKVNTAVPGGHISTTEYDRFGNDIRDLTPRNRVVALATSGSGAETLSSLGIDSLSTAERAHLLSTTTLYDSKGLRELEVFGPMHRIDLTKDLKESTTTLVTAGTSVPARSWTVNEYDEGRPTDGTATIKDQVTLKITGVRVRDYYSVQGEERLSETQYDWAKGLPELSIEDPGGLALVTSTAYDAQGRVTDVVPPAGTGSDAVSKVVVYWEAAGTGWCEGRPEWAGLECWNGPAGAITGGGGQPTEVADSTTEYGYYGQVTKKTDTANGAGRTTTTEYDVAGRVTTVRTTGGLGTAVPDSTTGYDSTSGLITQVTSPTGGSITTAYDKLGRKIAYTDADANTTRTEYDLLDRPVKISDSVPSSTTFTYDHSTEPRGLTIGVADSVAGTFGAAYDADGEVVKETLPGGYTLDRTLDPEGSVLNRTYTRAGDGVTVFSDSVSETAHGQVSQNAGWSNRSYQYDNAGRLVTVNDTSEGVCTRRAYTFDSRSNRKSLTSAASEPGADCQTTGGTATNYTYDSADRLVDSGYVYDAFGRTTALPGATVEYYANDLVRQQTANGERQTLELDAALRFRSAKTEVVTGSTWTQSRATVNHYSCECDSPSWVAEDTTGTVTRNVNSLGGDLAAITGKSGDVVLQLTDIHGDVSLQLPLDADESPVALEADEYGNPTASGADVRYGWLGAKQRAADTPTGFTLMGVRLYNPNTGRFLQQDPVYGGGDNTYGYPADPITMYDLNGKWWSWSKWKKFAICVATVAAFLASFTPAGASVRLIRSIRVIKNVGIRRFVSYVRAMRKGKKTPGTVRHAAAVILGYSSIKAACKGI